MPRQLSPVDGLAPATADAAVLTRVVLANDHRALRRELSRLLRREDDLEVVGEASDFESAVREVAMQAPDVLVLDLRMRNESGTGKIELKRRLSPSTAVVATTMQDNELYARRALAAGALGFVVADTADLELADAVRRAARGRVFVSPRVTRAVA